MISSVFCYWAEYLITLVINNSSAFFEDQKEIIASVTSSPAICFAKLRTFACASHRSSTLRDRWRYQLISN
jgi:hypothetical protein